MISFDSARLWLERIISTGYFTTQKKIIVDKLIDLRRKFPTFIVNKVVKTNEHNNPEALLIRDGVQMVGFGMNELAFVVGLRNGVCGVAGAALAPNISSKAAAALCAYRSHAHRGFLFDNYRLTSLSLSVILWAAVRNL